MMLESYIKKLRLSLVVASAFSVSANAVCISENYCTGFYLGAGGFYDDTKGSETKVSNSGGFISIGGADLFFNRFQLAVDMRFGYGSNSVGGVNLANIASDNKIFQIDLVGKFGVNVLSANSPLFISFMLGDDLMLSNNGVGRAMVYIGASLDGSFAVSDKVKLTYGAGYGYIIGGAYLLGKNDVSAKLNGYNHLLLVNLGTQIKMSENLDFYLKAFGKYYDLNASRQVSLNGNNITMPHTTTWQIGLEAGIAF